MTAGRAARPAIDLDTVLGRGHAVLERRAEGAVVTFADEAAMRGFAARSL